MVKAKTSIGNLTASSVSGEPKAVRAAVVRNTERSNDYARLYANDMQMRITPWDIRMVFGQIVDTPTTSNPTITVREIGELNMSPQFAKRVAAILIGQLEHYERTIGVIPLPEE